MYLLFPTIKLDSNNSTTKPSKKPKELHRKWGDWPNLPMSWSSFRIKFETQLCLRSAISLCVRIPKLPKKLLSTTNPNTPANAWLMMGTFSKEEHWQEVTWIRTHLFWTITVNWEKFKWKSKNNRRSSRSKKLPITNISANLINTRTWKSKLKSKQIEKKSSKLSSMICLWITKRETLKKKLIRLTKDCKFWKNN